MPEQKARKHRVFIEGDCKVSNAFREAFMSFGWDLDQDIIQFECGACRRIHFYIPDELGLDDKEIKSLLDKVRNDPEGYVRHDSDNGDVISKHDSDSKDAISSFEFYGVPVIFGCPCHYDVLVEDQIWEMRRNICDYLVVRAKNEKDQSDQSVSYAADALKAISVP